MIHQYAPSTSTECMTGHWFTIERNTGGKYTASVAAGSTQIHFWISGCRLIQPIIEYCSALSSKNSGNR